MSLLRKGECFSYDFNEPVVFVEADGAVTGIMAALWIDERALFEERRPGRVERLVREAMENEIREARGWGVRLEDYDWCTGEWFSLAPQGRLADVYTLTAIRARRGS